MFIWCQFQIYTLWCHNYPIHHKNPERNWTKRLKTHFLVTYWLFNKDVKQWRYGIKLQRVSEFCSADIVYHLASMGECSFLFTIGNNHPKYSFLTKHHSFNVHWLVWKHEIDWMGKRVYKQLPWFPFETKRSKKEIGVAQWVARLTRDRWIPVSHEFEPHERPPLFPWARNFTLIA